MNNYINYDEISTITSLRSNSHSSLGLLLQATWLENLLINILYSYISNVNILFNSLYIFYDSNRFPVHLFYIASNGCYNFFCIWFNESIGQIVIFNKPDCLSFHNSSWYANHLLCFSSNYVSLMIPENKCHLSFFQLRIECCTAIHLN